ncbi:uncharacterized protein LOC110451497 isoform X2 [Mizuhopecten yessoensis]|uniref:uncharacterized protein LOC110451497 isoform X2 n=1 Tax=Mizuhopecten yessoensis TaxID=6573 RepID=UPI000B45CB35|nr:uncharacterized protein LOC110451497 isoform X2 [Mizuhopecten yessoensis]
MLTYSVALFLTAISVTNGSDDKRILLSDPQYIQQELTRFQAELQEIQVKYNTQNTKLTNLQVKYSSQNTELNNLQTKYSSQNTQLADLQTKNSIQNTQLADLQTKDSSQNTQLVDLQTKYNSLNTELANLQTKFNSQNTELKNLQSDKGAVVTRWGRRDCPANITTKVYSGYAGGSMFTSTGAAAEYVCMPNDPIWGPHKDLVNGDGVGFIYGAEYEEPGALFGMPGYVEDVPCAVCLGTQHTAYLMIPGRTQCYPGWTEVYQGYLASGHHGHAAASQYVCVDGDAQAVPGGGTHNEDGKLFYGVKTKCGSLPCPPYEDGKFLSCIVCMK